MRPTVPQVSEFLYEELAVAQPADEQLGWPFLIFLAGVGAAMGELPGIVRDTSDGPGWSALLDPARCPVWALPWLAQFAGVRITPGLTEAESRAEITSPNAFERGTRQGIISAAQQSLTGGKHVTVYERDTSPYRLTVITYEAETPDPPATDRDVREQKPAGLLLTKRVDRGWSVGQFETAYASRTVGDAEGNYVSIDALERHVPGGLGDWMTEPVPYGSFGAREGRAYRRRM